jgi:hypothetical protein
MYNAIWLSGTILLFWAGWWLSGAPTEGLGLWLPTGMTWYLIHEYLAQHLAQVRHGETLKTIATLERRLLLALGKYDEIPRMEWNLRQEEKRCETEDKEAILKMERNIEQGRRKGEKG